MIIGGVIVLVLVIVVAVLALGGDDEAPAPAPPTVVVVTAPSPTPDGTPAPAPVPVPVLVDLCGGHECDHGDCVADTAAAGYTCECNGLDERHSDGALIAFTGGALWGGDMCNEPPACGVCGAIGYCGPNDMCDPTVPPEPVVAQLTFEMPIESVPEEGSFARQAFENGFARDLATSLDMDASNIIILSISGGSVIIDFAILPNANFQVSAEDGQDGQYEYDPAAKLLDLAAMATSNTLVFSDLGAPTNVPAAILAPDSTLMCSLHLKRMEVCNGQTSVADVCSERNCLVALELAAAATECAGVDGFENMPSAEILGCDCTTLDEAGGCTVMPGDVMPNLLMSADSTTCFDDTEDDLKAAMLGNFPDGYFSSYSLLDVTATDMAMDGDVYIVPDFGAHFDGAGDRINVETGTTYGTDGDLNGDGEGFAIGFWFTKEVCNADDDRFEVLYHHTSDVANSVDLFNEARGVSCTADLPDGSSWTDASAADPCAAVVADAIAADESCTADAVTEPATDCTFTPGDASTCGTGCTYVMGVTGGEAACAAASGSVTDSSGDVDDDATVCSYNAARGTTSGIAAAVTCQSHGRPGGSTIPGDSDIVSFRIKDDNGVNPQFDWNIGCAGSGPGLQGTWIHLVLSVHPTSIRVYADGIEQNQFGFPQG
jgi:hypothetical protein